MSEGLDRDLVQAFVEAIRDPLRRRMLMSLGEDEALTIRQLAVALKEPTRRIRHQMDALVALGLVAVEAERPRRGTMERTFRAVESPLLWTEDWPSNVTEAETKMILLDILRYTFDEVSGSVVGGTFLDREGWCVSRMVRGVDARGWKELAAIYDKTLQDAMSVMEGAELRLRDSGEEPIRAVISLLLLEGLPRQS